MGRRGNTRDCPFPAHGGDTQLALPQTHPKLFKSNLRAAIKTQSFLYFHSLFHRLLKRGWKRDGERCCSPNPTVLGCPKRVQHPSRSCRALGPGSGPKSFPFVPKGHPSTSQPWQEQEDLWLSFFHNSQSCKFPKADTEGRDDGATSRHLFWNSSKM